jgi:hypothetical protein
MRKPLLQPERQQMLKMSKRGAGKHAIMKRFGRSFETVSKILEDAGTSAIVRRKQAVTVEAVNLALEKANSALPEVVALAIPPMPSSHGLEEALKNIRDTLRAAAPEMRSFSMNVETGVVDVEVVQRIRLSC